MALVLWSQRLTNTLPSVGHLEQPSKLNSWQSSQYMRLQNQSPKAKAGHMEFEIKQLHSFL